MAQAIMPGRASQMLPNVKCSSCGIPVPVTELGDHVCSLQPAMPTMSHPSLNSAARLVPNQSQSIPARNISRSPVQQPRLPQAPPFLQQQQTTYNNMRTQDGRQRGPPARLNLSAAALLSRTPSSESPSQSPSPSQPHRNRLSPRSDARPSSSRSSTIPNPNPRIEFPNTPGESSSSFPNDDYASGPMVRSRAESARGHIDAPLPNHPAIHERALSAAGFPTSPITPESSQSGGAAGMAGVGRRGFAAAAMLGISPQSTYGHQQFLEVNGNSNSGPTSPALSSMSGHGRAPSPMSARTPSPLSARTPSPLSASARTPSPGTQQQLRPRQNSNAHASGSRAPTQPLNLMQRARAPSSPGPHPSLMPHTPPDRYAGAQPTAISYSRPRAPSSPEQPPHLSGQYQASAPVSIPHSDSVRRRSRPSSTSSDIKLPYALSSEEEDVSGFKIPASPTRFSPQGVQPLWSPPKSSQLDSLARHFQPTLTSSEDSRQPSSASHSDHRTTMTSMSSYSKDSERSDDESRIPQRSNTIASRPGSALDPLRAGPKRSLTAPAPKVPAVTFSIPSLSNRGRVPTSTKNNEIEIDASKKSHRLRDCAHCRTNIADGRWVPLETNDSSGKKGVMCERCWKEMYLPKCRRCNKPIEKQAVSSSDGQLKGKYHRECFNCHICHKPFPAKEFYVHSGQPMCAYHYHEANKSLCAAPYCGQPIEGPCAMSHSNARYHPTHLTCEFPGCQAQLDGEYWEDYGKMLCERHARLDDDDGLDKMQRRITRYVDLSQYDDTDDEYNEDVT